MFFTLLILLSAGDFVPIEGFADLDAIAGPMDFGFLLIMSGDSTADGVMELEIVEAVETIDTGDDARISLYSISMNASGYSEIACLAGQYGGFPAVVTLVGHCGFLELDPEFLSSEIEDAWYQWGDGSTEGICNYCKRCNP